MRKNNKGFTLAELLVVVAIIGVLVAIAIPIFTGQMEKSRDAVTVSNLRTAYAEAQSARLGGDTGNKNIKVTENGVEVSNVEAKGTKPGFGNVESETEEGLEKELPFETDEATIKKDMGAGKGKKFKVTFKDDGNGKITATAAPESTT